MFHIYTTIHSHNPQDEVDAVEWMRTYPGRVVEAGWDGGGVYRVRKELNNEFGFPLVSIVHFYHNPKGDKQ